MSRSLKATHILLVAAFAAGLSACSGGGDSSAAAPTATVTVTASASASESATPSPSNPGPSALESAVPEPSTSAPATPSAVPVPGGRGTDAVLLGQVSLRGSNAIKVAPKQGGAQEAELTPFTVVLDIRGKICNQGGVPHECNVQQMQKTLSAGGSLYAKVTIKDGVATEIEEMAKK
ncbi:hypothetical protein [Streptosporangium lutulentum]|uniref:DUF5666 domain-containing protein n=1 Tax=Streptosporangium lutulentum TaxID=1461250 RepID=A0ABT9QKF8_9ACTN|nr:hypothetical protein [Streptosporangium lutulentum]MDP9846860.1 hypothetical protein [Streptosporangium lutulentum]